MLFTIIIPVYNKAEFIPALIESVQSQTLDDYEVIIVDDASKDNSLEILNQLTSSNDKFRVIKNLNNKGVAESRNSAIDLSKGQYLLFIDADDRFLDKNLFEEIKNYIHEYQSDYIFLHRNYYGKKKKPRIKRFDSNLIKLSKNVYQLRDKQRFIIKYSFPLGGSASAIVSKKLINKDDRFKKELDHFEDWLFFARILSKSVKPIIYKKDTVYINYSSTSLSRAINIRREFKFSIFNDELKKMGFNKASKAFFWIDLTNYIRLNSQKNVNLNNIHLKDFFMNFVFSKYFFYCAIKFFWLKFKQKLSVLVFNKD